MTDIRNNGKGVVLIVTRATKGRFNNEKQIKIKNVLLTVLRLSLRRRSHGRAGRGRQDCQSIRCASRNSIVCVWLIGCFFKNEK